MTKQELLKQVKIEDSEMGVVLKCHPLQLLSNTIRIPVWKIQYRYETVRGNSRESIKYLFIDESAFDLVEHEFNMRIQEFNENNPKRMLSNVEILDITFLGDLILELD